MTLYDIIQNWKDISHQKKRQALQKVIDKIDYDSDDDDLLFALLLTAEDFEGDDYFGTEGLNV